MQLSTYSDLRDSNVPWIQSVPSHWTQKRLKFVVELVNQKQSVDQSDLPYIGLEHIESWTGRKIDGEISQSEGLASTYASGDVLFGKLRPYLAKIHLADTPGLVSSEALVIRPSSDISSSFLKYYFLSRDFINTVDSSTYGSKMPRASWDYIGNLPLLIPSAQEQQAIVGFLDYKTAQIDALTAKKQLLLDKLAEQRTALISQAVTKGLDPSVPMRDSGVEWLGEIPTHWTVPILGYVAEVRGGVTKGRKLPNEATVEVPYLRVANVQDGFIDLSHVTNIEILVTELERYSLQKGDVLMNEGGDNDKLGRGAVWEGEISPCLHQNHVFAVRPRIPEFSDWLALLTQSGYAKFYFYTTAKQSTNLASISSSNIKKLPVLLPPEAERREIIDHVKTSLDKLTKQRERVIQVIERLKEYRSALITNAVTGKIDVRDFCIPTTTEQKELAHG